MNASLRGQLQSRGGGSTWKITPLLPLLQRGKWDAELLREFGLGQSVRLPKGTHPIWCEGFYLKADVFPMNAVAYMFQSHTTLLQNQDDCDSLNPQVCTRHGATVLPAKSRATETLSPTVYLR